MLPRRVAISRAATRVPKCLPDPVSARKWWDLASFKSGGSGLVLYKANQDGRIIEHFWTWLTRHNGRDCGWQGLAVAEGVDGRASTTAALAQLVHLLQLLL